ncbi:MAG: DUF177 domain-containing protein [Endomicrobiales bacterium]|jgi:uncharacterized protein
MSKLLIDVTQFPDSGIIQKVIEKYQSDALNGIVKDQAISISFSVQKLGNELLVQGTIRGVVEQECSCCLEPARWNLDLPFAQAYTADQTVIDIEPEVRDTLLINLPQKPLCVQDCKGLCTVCGGNKNTHPCECHKPLGDIRLTKLNDFFKK